MSTHAYIPLYVDDYDAATAHLTVEEDGAYSRLIRLCWRTTGCSLPNDEAWIARKIRLSADDFARIARPVLEEFFKLQRGRFVQKRLKAEYDDISRKKSVRKLAGKKGGEAKALKEQEKQASIATDLPEDTRAFPTPAPTPNPEPVLEVVGGACATVVSDDWPEGKATDHAKHLSAINPALDPARRQGLVTTLSEIARWRLIGASWDLDVIPAIVHHASRRNAPIAATWKFFSPAIERSLADRNRPAPAEAELEHPHERTRTSTPRQAAFAGGLSAIDRAMAEAVERPSR